MDRLARERRGRVMAERRLAGMQSAGDAEARLRPQLDHAVELAVRLCAMPLAPEQEAIARDLLAQVQALRGPGEPRVPELVLFPATFDLELALHEETVRLQPLARTKGVALIVDYDMRLPTMFIADAGRLRQVLGRLISNALRFTQRGHVLIRVVGVDQDASCRTLHITVEDTGAGLPPGQLSTVFEGAGLGPARAVVARMGGDLWAESEAGRGSCFGLRLRLPAAGPQRPAGLPDALRRALIVDDQFISRAILEKQLTACGIAVRLCRSTAEAAQLLTHDRDFDAVLVDADMPGGQDLAGFGGFAVVQLSATPDMPETVQKPPLRAALYDRLRIVAAQRRRMRVLAADDNRTNQLVLRKMVRDLALDLEFASGAEEAVEVARRFAPDLIFMDIARPGMTGAEAAQLIRTNGMPHVPIIALADPGEEPTPAIDFHMPKPLRKSAILAMLERFRPDNAAPLEEETRPLLGATG